MDLKEKLSTHPKVANVNGGRSFTWMQVRDEVVSNKEYYFDSGRIGSQVWTSTTLE
jgi:hypothetical protein